MITILNIDRQLQVSTDKLLYKIEKNSKHFYFETKNKKLITV